MKRSVALMAIVVLGLSGLLWVSDAWARVGGGGSSGSRGSRSYSAPAKPSTSPVSPSQPAAPASSPLAPQRSGWGGMLGGLLVGGLIGSMLFGGMGHGLFGGIGMMEILIVGGLIYLAFRFMRSRQPAPAAADYATAGGYGGARWAPQPSSSYGSTTVVELPAASVELDRGVEHIRQLDAGFDSAKFAETATDLFFKIQAAWTTRDMGRVADLLTTEMQGTLQKDCDRLRAARRVNRLENIAVRQAEISEAWEERGQDFATIHFLASLLDYTTDEGSGQVVDGSATDPVKFEEYWTFVRPVGPNPWKLSAIQQA
ncbi:MAG TPA: Tim44 domain-containing protein [Methylomirabilota bacterium]|jgi:predicted lipid-binding transport protein (Tim44 family)|nr:Tim44 domain-containing protein [Methylomirabilota bacterium]